MRYILSMFAGDRSTMDGSLDEYIKSQRKPAPQKQSNKGQKPNNRNNGNQQNKRQNNRPQPEKLILKENDKARRNNSAHSNRGQHHGGNRAGVPALISNKNRVDLKPFNKDNVYADLDAPLNQVRNNRNNRNNGRNQRNRNSNTNAILVSNLPYDVLEADLKEQFPHALHVWIKYDMSDRSSGTGGVLFQTPLEVQEAITTVKSIKGCDSIVVKKAPAKEIRYPRVNKVTEVAGAWISQKEENNGENAEDGEATMLADQQEEHQQEENHEQDAVVEQSNVDHDVEM
eukprot:GDKJ01031746.1.p1 GENE.GDKJ01031746.1~~GDKJ01031746.1.p1  ORF type:complete len:286 (-),score=85.72 GDKJ01031746.1:230-1087(-)